MRRIVALVLVCCLWSFGFAKGSHGGWHASKASQQPKQRSVKLTKQFTSGDTYARTELMSRLTIAGHQAPQAQRRPAPSVRAVYTPTVHATSPMGSCTPTVQRDKHGRIKTEPAKAAFEREHPCPSTGKTSARCPGYVVDYVLALECGGPDGPNNMQRQITADAKPRTKLRGSVESKA